MEKHNKTEIKFNPITGFIKVITPTSLLSQLIWATVAVVWTLAKYSSEIIHAIAPNGFIH
jgi:hypothetical protein